MKRSTVSLLALLCVAGCSSTVEHPPGESAPVVGRFASANPGSVNTYWWQAPQGLVVVDTQRSLTDAHAALAAAEATGSPIAAVLITHSHPDHVGGVGVFHQASPNAPVYASAPVDTSMRTDPLHFYDVTRALPNSDYALQITYPDHTFAPGATIDAAGTALETAEFGPGETETATAYYDPKTRALFAGDLVADKATPALLEGHSCGWLVDLDRLRTRFPHIRTIYPGHGAPGGPELIEEQRTYLEHFRHLVRAALPDGTDLTEDKLNSITAELSRDYPGYPSVASLPTLVEENVKSVAREIRAEDPGTLPTPCRAG
ncbi:MBL fold metallo-hydrolase [Nocardia sp. NBC_00403]|uniref:MBL fold metallo-hydrolase n=1 Tax=Nocardia sp. NBC_00403 TaxID=2975990 RepID=UPI002E1D28C9